MNEERRVNEWQARCYRLVDEKAGLQMQLDEACKLLQEALEPIEDFENCDPYLASKIRALLQQKQSGQA